VTEVRIRTAYCNDECMESVKIMQKCKAVLNSSLKLTQTLLMKLCDSKDRIVVRDDPGASSIEWKWLAIMDNFLIVLVSHDNELVSCKH